MSGPLPHAEIEDALRAGLAEAMRSMLERGLNTGTSGNAAARFSGGMLITPSAQHPANLSAEEIVFLGDSYRDVEPAPAGTASRAAPSSEWQLHQAVFKTRNDINAVVHCHSRFATALACAHLSIPAVHYLVGLCGASEVPLAPYARFGSDELAIYTAEALEHANACLLANHGLVACGETVEQAVELATEIEELAAVYWHTLAIGSAPKVIDRFEMDAVIDALKTYRTPTQ